MQTDTHRYHVAQRESYSAVRAHYHSNTKGKRKSVTRQTHPTTIGDKQSFATQHRRIALGLIAGTG